MATIIAWIFTIIMVLAFVYSSYRYVKESHKMSQSKSLIERRKRAKEQCYIKDAPGVSLDRREIYVLTLEELGIESNKPT